MRELKDYATCELVNELRSREGVKTYIVEPYEDLEIKVLNGPAIVLEITD